MFYVRSLQRNVLINFSTLFSSIFDVKFIKLRISGAKILKNNGIFGEQYLGM